MRDPYLYEGEDVLKNKLNIHDQEKLDQIESGYAIFGINEIKNNPPKIASILDLLQIHKVLFGDVYDWAGKPRTIDIYKGESILDGNTVDYVSASYIKQALLDLDKEFKDVVWEELDSHEKIENICYFISEFWHIHPFREGNTRTTAMALYLLIKQSGLHINLDFLSKNGKYFRNALVLSCLYSSSKSEYLLGIVQDAVTQKNISSKKYETIDGFEVNKYSYTKHTIEKVQTIKDMKDWNK